MLEKIGTDMVKIFDSLKIKMWLEHSLNQIALPQTHTGLHGSWMLFLKYLYPLFIFGNNLILNQVWKYVMP